MSKIYVIKRDGKVVDFDLSKISAAMEKAFNATDSLCVDDLLQLLSMRVVSTLSPLVKDDKIHVEDIQDCVEKVLCEAGFITVARAYIRYRHQHENIRNATGTLLDYKSVVDDYLKVLDWRVKENSTVTYSLGGLILSNSGAITANYWLSEIYDKEIADAHRNAEIHIHDLSMLSGYCAGWSLRQLIQEGLGGVPGKINSKPASHLSTLCNQMVNFLGILQNEWAGAQAFSSFDTYLAPFVKADNLSYKETKQCIQSFVYGVNTPSRWGCVDPATELLTVDGFKHYQDLKKGEPIYTWHDGKLEIQPLNEIIVKEHHGVMHNYRSHRTGYHQMVTPEHRVVLLDHDNKTVSMIRHSSDIFGAHEDLYMPIQFQTANLEGEFFGNEAFCDDMLDDIDIGKLSSDSARYIINQATDNHGIAHIDAKYVNAFQQIALIAGYTSFVTLGSEYVDITAGTVDIQVRNQGANYTVIHDTVTDRYESPYDGTVWCPNVDNGVVVFRRYGNVFISAQCQSPFSNITLDWVCPPDMKDMPAIVGGKEMDFTYGDCKKEMDMVNKAFIEIMIEGDANGRGFQYPIPTYSITKDFDWSDTENNRLLFEMTAKYGTPYFSNYINSDMEPSDVRSMCCRLRLDLRELRKKSGGYFGSGESTGSVGVVTINLPRIAYQAYNEQDFYDRLDKLMDISARSLKIKREVITKFLDAGLYPYTKRYLGTFANHFSTIGLVGMNEAGLNAKWLHKDLTHKETQQFAKDVLNHMRERLSDYQEQYGDLYNLEATPAESTSYRFAKHDKQDFPDIITANEHGTPYYTNSSHLPVGYTKDIFSALDVQDELQTLYTSGTVFHAFLGEKLPSWEAAAKLVRKIAENYKLPYYTMSPTYSVCPDCGYITGEQYTCPKCGKKTEVYSRITGYYRPVQNWNDGKTQEFKDRQTYDISSSVLTHQGPIQDTDFDEAVERAEETLKHDEPACLLFTTSTCPKCPIAKRLLDDAKVPYTLVVADKEPEKAKAYGIRQAPTLVCNTKDGEKITVSGLSEIKEFIQNLSKLAG